MASLLPWDHVNHGPGKCGAIVPIGASALANTHPAASHHLPPFITAPGETDVLMIVTGVILMFAVMMFGILFLRLHSLPERMAHRSHKLQFEIVAVLCLIALFTHMHIFWIAGLLLALIDLPDFGTPLNRIAGSAEKIAGIGPGEGAAEVPRETTVIKHESKEALAAASAELGLGDSSAAPSTKPEVAPTTQKESIHA
jgi:hypothetical protein